VRPSGRKIFPLIVELRGSPEETLEATRTIERARPSSLTVEILNRTRDRNPSFSGDFLLETMLQENLREKFEPRRTFLRILWFRKLARQISENIVP